MGGFWGAFFWSVEKGRERKRNGKGAHRKVQDNSMITQLGKRAAIYRASKHARLSSPMFCVDLSTDPTFQELRHAALLCCACLCLVGNFQSDPCIWWGLPPRDQLLVTKEAPNKKEWQKGKEGKKRSSGDWAVSGKRLCVTVQQLLQHHSPMTAVPGPFLTVIF